MPIGLDVIFYVFSEVNFIRPELAKQKLDTAFNRFASRFKRVSDWFGNIIIDSSAAEGGSFVDEFIEKRCDPEKTKIVRSKIWEVKPNDYGHEGWFKVYLGDSTRDAFMLDGSQWNPNAGEKDTYVLPEGLDSDRVLEVPMELYSEFNLNMDLSLNDHAGISTNSSNLYMNDRAKLAEAFTLPMLNPDVIELDFYDTSERLINHVKEAVNSIPEDRVLSVSFDINFSVAA